MRHSAAFEVLPVYRWTGDLIEHQATRRVTRRHGRSYDELDRDILN